MFFQKCLRGDASKEYEKAIDRLLQVYNVIFSIINRSFHVSSFSFLFYSNVQLHYSFLPIFSSDFDKTVFQHSRNCHGFRRVTFRIASHDCTTEKSRDGFSEGKAKARRWSDLPGKSLTTEALRTSTRTHTVHMANPGRRSSPRIRKEKQEVDSTTKTKQRNLSEDNRHGATYAKGADGSASERHNKHATREKARDT